MGISTAVMAAGHVYVGGTVSEGLITLITIVTAVTRLGLSMVLNISHVFSMLPKRSQSYNIYKNPPQSFLKLFGHVYINATEKLPNSEHLPQWGQNCCNSGSGLKQLFSNMRQ